MKFPSSIVCGICVVLLVDVITANVEFTFKKYTYKKKRDDRRYKQDRDRCERAGFCEGQYGVDRVNCIRKCMSEFCYVELYKENELEEGEVDVRLNSFKGCLYQSSFNYNKNS